MYGWILISVCCRWTPSSWWVLEGSWWSAVQSWPPWASTPGSASPPRWSFCRSCLSWCSLLGPTTSSSSFRSTRCVYLRAPELKTNADFLRCIHRFDRTVPCREMCGDPQRRERSILAVSWETWLPACSCAVSLSPSASF